LYHQNEKSIACFPKVDIITATSIGERSPIFSKLQSRAFLAFFFKKIFFSFYHSFLRKSSKRFYLFYRLQLPTRRLCLLKYIERAVFGNLIDISGKKTIIYHEGGKTANKMIGERHERIQRI